MCGVSADGWQFCVFSLSYWASDLVDGKFGRNPNHFHRPDWTKIRISVCDQKLIFCKLNTFLIFLSYLIKTQSFETIVG